MLANEAIPPFFGIRIITSSKRQSLHQRVIGGMRMRHVCFPSRGTRACASGMNSPGFSVAGLKPPPPISAVYFGHDWVEGYDGPQKEGRA